MVKIDKKYYSGEKLLSQKDRNGKEPGIYLSNSNRSAGKTTYFQIKLLSDFFDIGKKFLIIVRDKNELEHQDIVFDFVCREYFDGIELYTKWVVNKLVTGIFTGDGRQCAMCISLKDAVKLKKYSPIFGEVQTAIFDELQPEDGRYLKDEIGLMTSVMKTVSRGDGSQSRYIRWIYLSNNITIMNPYFLNLGIYKEIPMNIGEKVREDGDLYLRGDGWVAEFAYNNNAAVEMSTNPAIGAFTTRNNMLGLTADFMINCNSFIEKHISGKMMYLYTLKFKGKKYAVRQVQKTNMIYINNKIDPNFHTVVALSDNDHDDSTIQMGKYTFYLKHIRDAYARGMLRFSNLEVKDMMLELLGIDLYRF